MKDQQLFIFMEVLQSEFERLVIPDPSTEMARNTVMLAATQLRRMQVEIAEVPQLRRAAITSYNELLPKLRKVIAAEICGHLEEVLAASNASDWKQMEDALYDVIVALLSNDDEASRGLAGQLTAIDARLREGKEQVWIERSKFKTSDSSSADPTRSSDEQGARLLAFIKRQFPKETALRIGSIKSIPGGYGKQTFFVDLENNVALPDSIVMRRDGPYAMTSVTMEYPLIQKMYDAGVAVPQPYAIDVLGKVYGRPFILMSRAPGITIGDFVVVREPSREVALDLAKKMARLHKAPTDGLENVLSGGTVSVSQRLMAEIGMFDAMWKTVINQQCYVVQVAIDWLKRNIKLADGPRAVLHRDIGVHNMLVRNNEVTAFLDWETAVIGTPAEDVAYTYYTAVQMIDWEKFLSAYETESGVTLDRRQLDFYMLWASVRLVVGISKMVDPVFSGSHMNLAEYYLGDHIVQVLMQRIGAKVSEILA